MPLAVVNTSRGASVDPRLHSTTAFIQNADVTATPSNALVHSAQTAVTMSATGAGRLSVSPVMAGSHFYPVIVNMHRNICLETFFPA